MNNELEISDEQIQVEQTEVVSTVPVSVEQRIRPGYVAIRLRSGLGSPIIVNENQVGKTYKEDIWERVADKKK